MRDSIVERAPVAADQLQSMDEWGPEKVVCVSDSRTGMRGVLVIDNTARGMGKGGTRTSYVVGLDMGMTEHDAAIIQDELGDRGAAVGVPEELGGVPYDQLGVTGYGVAESVDAALRRAGRVTKGARVALQGFGAVGVAAARRLDEMSVTVVALSTARGGVHQPNGLDVCHWLALRAEHGDDCVLSAERGERLAAGEELTVDCDVLIPAATQDVIDESVASLIRASMVVEGANLPTTPAARVVLARRGVTVVPDFIANAGGVVAAAFAMDARYSAFRPDSARIFEAVSDKLRQNTETVLAHAESTGLTPHEAALDIATDRVRTAMRLRGRHTAIDARGSRAGDR